MLGIWVRLQNLLRREEGQTAVEYVLVIGLVSLVLVGVVASAFSGTIQSVIDAIDAKIMALIS